METSPFKVLRVIDNYSGHPSFIGNYHATSRWWTCLPLPLLSYNLWNTGPLKLARDTTHGELLKRLWSSQKGRGEWCWDCSIYKLVKKIDASSVKSQLPLWMVCVNAAQLLVCLWLLRRLQIQWWASQWIWVRNCAGIWRKKISKNCNSTLRRLPVRILWNWSHAEYKVGSLSNPKVEHETAGWRFACDWEGAGLLSIWQP
jgi:hypothetical protein